MGAAGEYGDQAKHNLKVTKGFMERNRNWVILGLSAAVLGYGKFFNH
jgi:hypothetical protein